MTTYATDSQGKFIPATQRPDGTWRKPRRIRDGYVPQEEVPLYESKGKLFAQKPSLPPGLPPEMIHKAKEKREKEQRMRQQREAEAARRAQQNPIPGLLILHDDNKAHQQQQQHSQQRSRPANAKSKKKALELPDVLLEQKQKEEQKLSRQQHQQQEQKNKLQQQQLNDVSKAVGELQLASSNASDGHSDLTKKLRKLRKKIREIEVIEDRLRSNDNPRPDKDQIEKAKRKPEILKEIEELERSMPK
ncbi:partner of Y14 and mago [Topomyia yanbarensis]|uniref:partner of Y14 and mago n=1 Tax=Topomyia yanbarensis TaxID=2498891 RepID=UPI00273AC201|nr:partner of Y14 and mago [Topomyia yanbarensis]